MLAESIQNIDMLKLIKIKSDPCLKCKATDFKLVGSSKACVDCFTYVFKELNRDISNKEDLENGNEKTDSPLLR